MKGGVITERNPEFCTIRTRIPAGVVTTAQIRGLADIAEKNGGSTLHLTTRQTVEIPHMDPAVLKEIAADLTENGTPVGSERDEVVNIISCPGMERCVFANIDSIHLAQELDRRLFGKEMPVKVRIAISSCPNACTSPMLNEIGIIGRMAPVRVRRLSSGGGYRRLCLTGACNAGPAYAHVPSSSSRPRASSSWSRLAEEEAGTPISGGNWWQ
jgi:anaerobic sulfite reductase subunit C